MRRGLRTPSEIRLLASRGHPFWSVVQMTAGDGACWPWGGAVDRDGYGCQGRDRAQRIAWELANRQDLLAGQAVMHSCDSSLCCNPKHLIAAPIADGIAARGVRGAFNGRAQLSNSQVLGIYLAQGSYDEIGGRFGVSKWAVSDIKTGRNWAWLTGHIPQISRIAAKTGSSVT